MPLYISTPFDHDDAPGTSIESRRRWPRLFADSCYLLLKSMSFTLTTFLMVLGLPLFFFLAVSGWNMELLFLQLDNLASRYVDADHARQLVFSDQLRSSFYLSVALVALWRIPGFVSRLSFRRQGKDEA